MGTLEELETLEVEMAHLGIFASTLVDSAALSLGIRILNVSFQHELAAPALEFAGFSRACSDSWIRTTIWENSETDLREYIITMDAFWKRSHISKLAPAMVQ